MASLRVMKGFPNIVSLKNTENCFLFSTLYRFCSSVPNNLVQLSQKIIKVKPGFGNLNASGSIDYCVKAACTETYPDADHAIVTSYGPKNYQNTNIIKIKHVKDDDLHVSSEEGNFSSCYCEVQVPIKYNLNVCLNNNANIHIEKLESEKVLIDTDTGHLTTKGLKTFNLTMNTHSGTITTEGALQGNLFLTANETAVTAQRLQGISLNIKSKKLKMNVKSSYMDNARISANDGDLKLCNLHGSTHLELQNGTLDITGFHGHLIAYLSNVNTNMQISTLTQNSEVQINEGKLNLSIIQDAKYGVEIYAPKINAEEVVGGSFHSHNERDVYTKNASKELPTIIFNTKKGSASVKLQDWFSTLGIKVNR